MLPDLMRHLAELSRDGLTVVPPGTVIPESAIKRWRTFAFDSARALGHNLEATARDWVYNRDGERHSYAMVDGAVIKSHLPDMHTWYEALTPLVSVMMQEDAVVSPHPLSDVNVLLYDRPADAIGWHYDTNPITFLLYLTDNSEGGTECRLLKRRHDETPRVRIIQPRAGAVLLMKGRCVEHRGLPVQTEKKACAVWNYYAVGDLGRPSGYDEAIYGTGNLAVSATW